MPRVQAGYQPGAEALQTRATPNIQAVQETSDPRSSKAFQLAEAFGSPSVQKALEGISARVDDVQQEKARAYANSMTVDELGKAIKDKKILETQSPIYVATVQHMYGANLETNLRNDVLSKLDSGTLSAGEVEGYLTKNRNEQLAGQSSYTLAGFDRGFGQSRDALLTAAARKQNANYKDNAGSQSATHLGNKTSEAITAYAAKPDEAIAGLMKEYDLQVQSGVLSDPTLRRQSLTNILSKLSATGNEEMVQKFLSAKTPNNGPVVSAILDSSTPGSSEAVINQAKSANLRLGNERTGQEIKGWFKKIDDGSFKLEEYNSWAAENARYLSQGEDQHPRNAWQSKVNRVASENQSAELLRNSQDSVAKMSRSVENALATGIFNNGAGYVGAKVATPSGGDKDFDAKEVATKILMDQTKDLPLDQRVIAWKKSGLADPQLSKVLQTGIGNLYTVGIQTDGKKAGELDASGTQAIEMYNKIASFDPVYADTVAGAQKDDMRGIHILMNFGMSPAEAARTLNESKANNMDNVIKKAETRDKVKGSVNDALKPGFWGSLGQPVNTFRRLMGLDPSAHLDNIAGDAIEAATLLYGSGRVPLDEAVAQVGSYLSKTYVVVRGNPYYQGHLPNAPYSNKNPMDQRIKWMERFIGEVPGREAEAQKLDMAHVTLTYNKSSGTYSAMSGAYPISKDGKNLEYTPDDINKWTLDMYNTDLKSQAEYPAWSKGVKKSFPATLYTDSTMRPIRSQQMQQFDNLDNYKYLKSQDALGKSIIEQNQILLNRKR